MLKNNGLNFESLTPDSVLSQFSVTAEKGLSPSQVKDLQEKHGFNELNKKGSRGPFLMFIDQFRNFIIYILFFAVGVSILAGEWSDALVIVSVLVFNAIVGFFQEYKAEKSIEALAKLTPYSALVLRGGKEISINAREIVPGDIILISEGNRVPADCRLIDVTNLEISEASLTGESAPVQKQIKPVKEKTPLAERTSMLYAGTLVTRGKGKAVVISIGMSTEIGKIAALVSGVEVEQTPLQKKLEELGKKIGMGTVVVCCIVFITGTAKEGFFSLLIRGHIAEFVLATKTWFLTAVSLAVAAVPEGLPAIVTVTLALGVRQMVKRHALVRRLASVETLGETTVICSDKTGTLTKNEMTVRAVWAPDAEFSVSGEGYATQGKITALKGKGTIDSLLLKVGALCNDAALLDSKTGTEIRGDPTEAALLVSAQKAGFSGKDKLDWNRFDEKSFDSIRKLMTIACKHKRTGDVLVCMKGAPESVLERCSHVLWNGKIVKLSSELKKQILVKNDEFASRALRVLGFAYKEDTKGDLEKNLIFLGLQGMIDPPHVEVPQSIAKCHEAGIRVIMITGDNPKTAECIAHEIGIPGTAMTGAEFAALSKKDQIQALRAVSVFARVEPVHKLAIVELLQGQGQVVAMTGDGVNDAPALKKADVGIAMGITGTDVAKEASQMILEDDNFTSIVNAIEEGRGIYENISKFVNYLLSCNIAEVLIIFLAILFGMPVPMTAIMLLWLNFVTDGFPALAISVDPRPLNVMQRPPVKATEGILSRKMFFVFGYVSVVITAGILGLFAVLLHVSDNLLVAQTSAMTALILSELLRLQLIRRYYGLGIFSNPWLVAAACVSLGLQMLIIYTPLHHVFEMAPLDISHWMYIVGAVAFVGVMIRLGEFVSARVFSEKVGLP